MLKGFRVLSIHVLVFGRSFHPPSTLLKRPNFKFVHHQTLTMEIRNQDKAKTTRPSKRRKKNHNPEADLMFNLGTCSKNNDLSTALSLYETAVSNNLHLNHNHFNTLIYLCSNSLPDSSSSEVIESSDAIEKGFRIFDHMLENKINPTEATITSVARLAVGKGDAGFAYELVKTMGKYKILPRLRTYDPALFAFCRGLEVEKAYMVEEDMVSVGIQLEELELAALLKLSSEVGREERVYMYLHKLRNCVRCVKSSTAEIVQGWFLGESARRVGIVEWDKEKVRDTMLKNGGGWHGQGWFGKGNWNVCKSNVSFEGCCSSCGERLACVDIDRMETEKFGESIASLAFDREVRSNFKLFQEWLDNHAGYEAIVDGANVGLYQQNFSDGGFSIFQLDAVVKQLYEKSQKKWPLVILHNKRVRSLMDNPSSRKVIEEWRTRGALYTTPNGSNDDWYWLYAAVKLKCLLVTNDEMRDHIFELLGTNFFLKWKERHHVRFTFQKFNLTLQMPPLYSIVIQESEKGSWHVPVEGECSDEVSRTWLCIFRSSLSNSSESVSNNTPPDVCEAEAVKMNGFCNTPT